MATNSRWPTERLSRPTIELVWRRFAYYRPEYDTYASDTPMPRFAWSMQFINWRRDREDYDWTSLIDGDFTRELNSETEMLQALAKRLVIASADADNHLARLNQLMSSYVLCAYDRVKPDTIDTAYDLLSRLPPLPPEVTCTALVHNEDVFAQCSTKYFVAHHHKQRSSSWTTLQVVAVIDACTLRLALAISNETIEHLSLAHSIRFYIHRISRLLDTIYTDGPALADQYDSAKAIAIAYLWSMWHRSVTLFLALVLRNGYANYTEPKNDILSLEYPRVLLDAPLGGVIRGASSSASSYMCCWAYELLRSSKASLSFDFRSFHQRFEEAHGMSAPRCTVRAETCDGSAPEQCGRFNCKELVLEEQSFHEMACKGCKRIVWDETSYRKASKGRAVDISKSSDRIRYCNADEKTLAISHVWSHGQGGRPSTGINRCLHKRYVQLARTHRCKSYWIDTVCIPEGHVLRKEAIAYINETFSDSKMTLIADRDLASMEAPREDISQAERLLATLLVCDWNVRAWTLLEAIRGSSNLHIICLDNQLVSVKSLIFDVLSRGALELAVLALGALHLQTKRVHFTEMGASALLSHRYATRPNDDIVIWSLMCARAKSDITNDPTVFWKSKRGAYINTGFIMSSAPRLQGVKNFSWAPKSPNVRSLTLVPADELTGSYPGDGEGSELGQITEQGLRAVWLIHHPRPKDYFWDAIITTTPDHRLEGAKLGLPAKDPCWERLYELMQIHTRVCLLMPKSNEKGRYQGPDYGKTQRILVATAFSRNRFPVSSESFEDCWTWDRIFQWYQSASLPKFEWENILLR